MMAGKFILSKSANGQFRFVLKAANAETILTSELYTSKSAAQNGIEAVRSNCGQAGRYERKTATNGKYYFNLKAANHRIIATSQMYVDEAGRDKGIASVMQNGVSSEVNDES